MQEQSPYSMTLSLNVLNHLGLNLYSNVAAVVAETIANSWDADATEVDINVDIAAGRIEIIDNGNGMNIDDINSRYLHVGYMKREDPDVPKVTSLGRAPMGRKGIGKLSLFSIARHIELHSKKQDEHHGFALDIDKIKSAIESNDGHYSPAPTTPGFMGEHGTKIVLSELKSRVTGAIPALKRRLARRFSIIAADGGFNVRVNGVAISPIDRDYYHKIEYAWCYDDASKEYLEEHARNARKVFRRSGDLGNGERVSGWIASAALPSQLKDEFGENLNRIVVMVRDKLAQEDILEEFAVGGVYSKYLFGELEADFLDRDDEDDIATSSRQQMIEDDPRYISLRSFVGGELGNIKNKWSELRNEDGLNRASQVPAIRTWIETLSPDLRGRAATLFGKINQYPAEDENQKNTLLAHGVLAFETFRYRNDLEKLETIDPSDLHVLSQVFGSLDDIEATLYYQITRERIAMIRKLESTVGENALEKVIQDHLFSHLWLLDPSWDRATDNSYMEQKVKDVVGAVDAGLSQEQLDSRLDIRYKQVAGTHVVVELKRPGRTVKSSELYDQILKYKTALDQIMSQSGDHNPLEFVCILGRAPTDANASEMLKLVNCRIVYYEELLRNALSAYQEYLSRDVEAGRVFSLIQELDPGFFG